VTQSSFFPLSTEERANRRGNARLKDIMDLLREKGLDPRSPGFYRTENSEETAKRWEEVGGGLLDTGFGEKAQGSGKE